MKSWLGCQIGFAARDARVVFFAGLGDLEVRRLVNVGPPGPGVEHRDERGELALQHEFVVPAPPLAAAARAPVPSLEPSLFVLQGMINLLFDTGIFSYEKWSQKVQINKTNVRGYLATTMRNKEILPKTIDPLCILTKNNK